MRIIVSIINCRHEIGQFTHKITLARVPKPDKMQPIFTLCGCHHAPCLIQRVPYPWLSSHPCTDARAFPAPQAPVAGGGLGAVPGILADQRPGAWLEVPGVPQYRQLSHWSRQGGNDPRLSDRGAGTHTLDLD